jgi:anti-sigma regulatory factor (Ser/Thr protein kinase)
MIGGHGRGTAQRVRPPVGGGGSWRRSRTAGPHLQLEIERNVEAPGIARAAATGLCQEAGIDQSSCFTVVLLVSEVVTNAVLHSAGPTDASVGLNITVGEDVVRVTVTDAGEGFTPKPRDPASRGGGGYGLYLLEKSASRWGVSALDGTCVWFEVALPGRVTQRRASPRR